MSDIAFTLIQRADCDGFVSTPRFKCLGGSAILATHEGRLRSWRWPLYQPSLRSFLAFDAEERLADYTVFLQGGN